MDNNLSKITIVNSAIMPMDGNYLKRTISKNQFIDIINNAKIVESSIGYDSVAELINNLTNKTVSVNRDVTIIKKGFNLVGLNLDYRLNPDDKGRLEPTEDDYVYYVAYYQPE